MDRLRLAEIRFFLLDMDGTVYLGPNPLPGAIGLLKFLRQSGRAPLFVTNNPTSDANEYSLRLTRMGIESKPEEILTSGEAIARYLAGETPYRNVFVVGMPCLEQELIRAGIRPVQDDPEAVVVAFDKTLTYEKLSKASLFLQKDIPYFATNPDRACPTEYGYIPDCGATTALLEAATGRIPKYIGKPSPEMVRMAMKKLGAAPEQTAMVGDRLYTDMAMAHNAGVMSILVLTGETKREDLAHADQQPDLVFDSLAELHEAIAAP